MADFRCHRRALLRGASGAALALPLLEAMFERSVYAQAASAPKRFVFVYCGIPPVGEEVDRQTGKPPQFVLPDAAGPLHAPFKVGLEPLETAGPAPDTTVISGMRIPRTGSGNGRRFGSSGFHYETMGPLVSGVSALNDNFSRYALGPSCDWLLASKIGMATRFPSLVYLVQAAEHTNGYTLDYISFRPRTGGNAQYDPPTLRNDPIVSPRVAFDQLFTGFTPPTTGRTAAAARPRAGRCARTSWPACSSRTPGCSPGWAAPTGSAWTSTWRTSHALEQRVNASRTPSPTSQHRQLPGTRPGRAPIPPPPPATPTRTAGPPTSSISSTWPSPAICPGWSRSSSPPACPGIVLPTSLGITYRNWDGSPLRPPPLHEATHGQGNNLSVAECIRWHMKHVAALAKKLKDTPDATGTMLDNTVIVFVMEAGLGNTSLQGSTIVGERPPHTSEGMAAVVVGGKSPGHAAGHPHRGHRPPPRRRLADGDARGGRRPDDRARRDHRGDPGPAPGLIGAAPSRLDHHGRHHALGAIAGRIYQPRPARANWRQRRLQ